MANYNRRQQTQESEKRHTSPKCPGRLWGPPSLLYYAYRGLFHWRVWLTAHLHVVPWLSMSGAIQLSPICLYDIHKHKLTFTILTSKPASGPCPVRYIILPSRSSILAFSRGFTHPRPVHVASSFQSCYINRTL
jgi:hypothetical protein